MEGSTATLGVLVVLEGIGIKADRFFYTGAGALFLVLSLLGFQQYIFGGKPVGNRTPIEAAMVATVAVHSASVFAWFVLFFVQSLLISTQNRRVHMKLGWGVLGVASMIVLTGPLVAVRSTRSSAFGVSVFDWPGRRFFLLIMLTEILLFVTFVAIGTIYRKQPRVHRPMMLLASLAMISGATGRIGWVNSIFGFHTWTALFGPVVTLGALLLLMRSVMMRRPDHKVAYGFAGLAFGDYPGVRAGWDGRLGQFGGNDFEVLTRAKLAGLDSGSPGNRFVPNR